MSNYAYPRIKLGPAPLAEGADPTAEVSGAQGARNPSTKRDAHKSSIAIAAASQQLAAVEAAVLTWPLADRQRLAAVLAGLEIAVEAERAFAPKQAAAMLGVSASTIRSRCASGRLGHRLGGRWRITASEVRAILQVRP